MKSHLILVVVVLTIISCAEPQINEGIWIEKENENRIITIVKDDGKYWISQFDQKFEIMSPHSNPYVEFPDRKMPISFSNDKSLLYFIRTEYIPLAHSKKGRFIGHWKSLSSGTQFLVQLDSNIELNWDIIKRSEKPVRYYPKPTHGGVHFTVERDTLSFEVKDGLIIDNSGVEYSREDG